jgi:hypothetical protein
LHMAPCTQMFPQPPQLFGSEQVSPQVSVPHDSLPASL